MGEHSPSPTPSRGVYGFALYLASVLGFVFYVIWASVPDSVLSFVGISYYPQKYWAIAIPVYCMMGIAIFAFFIYPSLNLLLMPPIDSMKTITDSYAIYRNSKNEPFYFDCGAGEESSAHSIPPVSDIHISQVCKVLYLNRKS